MNFNTIKTAVAKKFQEMTETGQLFVVGVDKDLLWSTYLSSFPEGSNPIFRTRTHHDCSCCRAFIKKLGPVVIIQNNQLVSIWDVQVDEPAYQTVANAMSKLVKSCSIENVFLHYEKTVGVDKNFETIFGNVSTWEHFFAHIPAKYVVNGNTIGSILREQATIHNVFRRSLEELTQEAIDTALDLTVQNILYRGQEHLPALQAFKQAHDEYHQVAPEERDNYLWNKQMSGDYVPTKIRNSAIGTLLVDLSKDMDLVDAVRRFESVMAPANYKNPIAIVTTAMVEEAKKTIESLGLTSALRRRYANVRDITVNNVIYTDGSIQPQLNTDVFDAIKSKIPEKIPNFDRMETMGIDVFIEQVIPTAESIEVFFDQNHQNNLMSLITAVDPTSDLMFKWDNRFSWTYIGNVADSIKERVKQAGGKTEGFLCNRLAWDYADDLDFHMEENTVKGRAHIYYNNKGELSLNGGMLDVDANGLDGIRENPVENIVYEHKDQMSDGICQLSVHNYAKRDPNGVGFTVEIELNGEVHTIHYGKPVKSDETVPIATFVMKDGELSIREELDSIVTSKEVWGIATHQFHPVKCITLSPNYWDENAVGNKHYFFILDGCKNDGTAKGFLNEYLKEVLTPHRKVMQIVGNKTQVEESQDQLSGLGFSSTKRDELLVRVSGKFKRMIKIQF